MKNTDIDIENTTPKSLRRIYIRCFVAIALVVIAVDTAPTWRIIAPLQAILRPALNVAGLWQGEWPLFAPNPVINNGWISAEFYETNDTSQILAADGTPLSWNSPIWSECNTWNKFYRFRHVNYFNRVAIRGKNVLDDLADYVAREKLGSNFHFIGTPADESLSSNDSAQVELRLTKNSLQIVLPEDGSLPSPEDTTWIYVGSSLGSRRYSQ